MGFDIDRHKSIGDEIRSASPTLARKIVDRQYEISPELLARFGQPGYDKSISDAEHNLMVLSESLSLGDPGVFSRYTQWLQGVLTSAGVPSQVLPAHLDIMSEMLGKICPELAGHIAIEYISTAKASLAPEYNQPAPAGLQ